MEMQSNVSETASASIIRVDVNSTMHPDDGDRESVQNIGW
jgi:hypothetical protein